MGILLWTTFWNLFELHQVFFFFLPSPNVLLLVYVTHEYIESGFHVSPSPRVCDTFSIFAYFHNLDSLGKYWLGVLKYALISEFSYSFFFVCVIRLELLVFEKDTTYVKRPSCHMIWRCMMST